MTAVDPLTVEQINQLLVQRQSTVLCHPDDEGRILAALGRSDVLEQFKVVTSIHVTPGEAFVCQPMSLPVPVEPMITDPSLPST